MDISVLKNGNHGKNLEIKIKNDVFERYPIKTNLIHIKEDISPIWKQIKERYFQSGDFIAISEKFITISEGRLIHKTFLKPGVLAILIYWLVRINLGEKSYENDPAFAVPEKIQAAIILAGWWRMLFATVIGIPLTFIWKIFGKKRGWFYIIAGHRISEIDGTFSDEMPPFNEFAKIYPEDPDNTCQEIEDKYGIPSVIIDGNNINTEILGRSEKIPLSNTKIREILLDNPMGQGSELTPIVLIRKK